MLIYPELEIITNFYGDRKAHRSGVPLINHIHEGISIIRALNGGVLTRTERAFCIHPIVQMGIKWNFNDIAASVVWMAEEYAQKANSFLCKPETDHITAIIDVHTLVGKMSHECAVMLYADKIQNQKDFQLYHQNSHPRSKQLTKYFNTWLKYLLSYHPGILR